MSSTYCVVQTGALKKRDDREIERLNLKAFRIVFFELLL